MDLLGRLPNEDISEKTFSCLSIFQSFHTSPGYNATYQFHQDSTMNCVAYFKTIDTGIFEHSNSSYRSRWFCVPKKDGKSLQIVQSLEPLNKVTITHSGVPPFTEQLAEQFAGRACNSMMDLYVGYDERALAPSSRNLTMFQTPFSALRLTTLPMGWTNSVPIFHDDVTHILRPEVPHVTLSYIDDVPVCGPATEYLQENGEPETISDNPGIRRFIWEHFQDLNRVVQRTSANSGFQGPKEGLSHAVRNCIASDSKP